MTTKTVESVETISSYARRTEDGVQLVLHLPGLQADEGTLQLRLAGPRGKVRTEATVTATEPGMRVEAHLGAKQLSPGVWRIALRQDPEAPFVRAQARLLMSTTQPIALLPGPAPRTRLEPPVRAVPSSPARRALREAGRLADRALSVLPADRAERARETLRSSAHRILG
jgi:hypothetical protein